MAVLDDCHERCTECRAIVGTWYQVTDANGRQSTEWKGTVVVRKERLLPGTLVGVPLMGPDERLCETCARKR